MGQVLSLEEFSAIDTEKEPTISQKKVLSISDFEHLGSAEEAIRIDAPSERFSLEKNVFKTMAKGSKQFFDNIGESFKIGNEASNIDMMGYSALTGELDYQTDVKPIRDEFNKRVTADPVKSENILSDAIYTVSGMIPAMGKGLIKGKELGMAAAIGVSAMGPAGVAAAPAAFAVGDVLGSMDYWYKQGSGSLYSDLKEEDLDDGIAVPVSHVAGAFYGAIEFSQVDKFFPGAKKIAKDAIVKTSKRLVAELIRKVGVNWASEVSEEVLQEVIMSTATDIATNIAEKTNLTIGQMAEKAMTTGWTTAKKSAIPMLLLMSPSAGIGAKRIIDEQKTIQQSEEIISEAEQDGLPVSTAPAQSLEEETTLAVGEALAPNLEDADFEDPGEFQQLPETEESGEISPTTGEGKAEDIISADAFDEFADKTEPGVSITEDLQRISETDEFQNKAQKVAELQGIIDTFNAKKESQDQDIKIKRFRGGYLAEKLRAIPKKFFTSNTNAMTLDELADSWNVSLDEAIDILKSQALTKKEISEVASAKQELAEIEAEMRRKNPAIQEAVSSITKKSPKLKLSQSQIIKRLFQERAKGERRGFRSGRAQGQQEVKSAKQILERRKNRVKGLSDMLGLSDADMKKVSKRDIRLMSNHEFKQHIDKLEAMAAALAEKRDVKNRIAFEIEEKRLKGVKNLQKALKLPNNIESMSLEQLKQFEEALSGYEADDEFLSVRKLETVDNTELAGIKTVREAKERLAQKLGVPLDSVQNIKVSALDKFRFDTALAEKNPFYKLLVDETNKVLIDAEQQFLEMEKQVDELVKKARASKKQGIVDKLVPADEVVFEWLEADSEKKKEMASALSGRMTDAELDLAHYLRERFAQFRNYLIKAEVLKKYKLDYITHIRRGFLETWKADGLVSAFKEVFNQYKEDQAIFQILDGDTQNILPLEKFFQFSMRRSGELKPSQNVSKAFKAYAQAILKKQALDRIVPALDIYAYSLSPKEKTPRGLQMNRQLIQFTREWINNKKGRKSSLGGILPQGGAVDIGLRAINGFITLIDLGLNIPVGLTVSIGEQVTEYVTLGAKKYSLGIARMNTKKGKQIAMANESFVGKSPWRELANTADSIGDKFNKALFLLFETSQVRANKIHLLGSLTEAEWESGQVDSQRLAELRREMGRFRAIAGAKSIFGSTSAGGTLTKYKTWALPILRTVATDLITLTKMLSKGDVGKVTKSREFQELFRATLATGLIALAGRGLVDDDDDDSFLGEIIRKAYRESMSIIGALDPTVLSSVRLASFLGDLASSIKLIVTLEEYRTKEGLKGVDKLVRTLTPKAVKHISKKENSGGRSLK